MDLPFLVCLVCAVTYQSGVACFILNKAMKAYVEVKFGQEVGPLAFWPTSDKSERLRGS